ncbi:MAG: TIGR03960 family B12-binding radical SAM protein [Endomicrobium sp.]|jgi:radical SAM family uncharacterized protein/radical SAM-linked protein|nr:TIGR03960 family B12-binding radical SAM protein [Endomicrobium sp.]
MNKLSYEIDRILRLVQKPARYINNELNSYPADMSADFSIVLCFPDLYEIGASNLGLEILYHLINEKKLARCERVFAPDNDLELLLRKTGINLFSLESNSSLKSFDILGFTVQCELVATNIVNILNLSGIPIFSKNRKNNDPLVIAGGPALTNPEPLCDFFDLFVLGDGEETIEEIIKIHKKSKKDNISRFDMLKNLLNVNGIYIPSFYDVKYNSDNTIKSVTPLFKDVPYTVNKRRSLNLDVIYSPEKKIVPFVNTIHNRLNVEITRGCLGQCRFCQAAKYYYPWRQKSPKKLIDIIKSGVESTGFEEISFSSLSCSDYEHLDELLAEINKVYDKTNLNISIPSLRCNERSLQIAKYISSKKKPTLTFAPEAGTERMRNVIGKYLSEKQIIKTLLSANAMGWKIIKLYFMIGLPTETDEDIFGIKNLIELIRKESKNLNFNITISPFIPKAQTAFQWVPMESVHELKRKTILLNKILPAKITTHNYESSILEALIAKGDRKISLLIYRAWQKGARFDQWADRFFNNIWNDVIAENKIDLNFYIYRNIKSDEMLPWEHLNFGTTKDALRAEYIKSLNEASKFKNFNVSGASQNIIKNILHTEKLDISVKTSKTSNILPVMRLIFRFSKNDSVKFVSHLQQIEVFRRAMRRSGLPIAFTEGFNSKVKASYGPPISIGQESLSEYMELYFTQKMNIADVRLKFLNIILPKGFKLIDIKRVPLNFPALDTLLNVSEYEIKNINISQEDINNFLSQNKILVERTKKNKIVVVDVKPLIISLKNEDNTLKLKLRFGAGKTINPEIIFQKLLLVQRNYEKTTYTIKRTNMYIEIKNKGIYEL